MMPGFGTNSTMGSTYVPARVDYNTSSESSDFPLEYIYEQGLSYPATNGYAYYTGFEAPVEWSEYTNFLGVEGQNLQLSNDNLPYLYCTPGYGFSYCSPDQYTYMPSMFMGVDGSLLGSQQYVTSTYQPPGSPSGYFPVFIQPPTNFNSTVSLEPPLFSTGTSVATRPANTSIKIKHQMSGNTTLASQAVPYGSSIAGPSQSAYQSQSTSKPSDPANANVARRDKPATSHITIPVDASLANKDGKSDEGNQLKDHVPSGARTSGDKGPRANSPGVATTTGEGGPTKAVSGTSLENIVIHPDQYNKDDFLVDHPDSKFFVIKSYSEDDVHKSIKYNVWSSTPNGNRRLDAAYSDAQGRTPGNCHIFLFFSVNTSGQFCGVAEMVGPVDFHKDMDFWQQDKWSGSFPVKWHLIKDVSNSTFRHIILENNENKPVTNSRDTQEIPYKSGVNMLKLFKNSPMTTSILDDFPFYEGRQKAMLDEKRRRLGRSFHGIVHVPAFIAKNNVGAVGKPSEVVKGQTGQDYDAFEQPHKVNQTRDGLVTQLPKMDGVTLIGKPEHVTDQDNARVDKEIGNWSSSAPPENGETKPADLSELVKVNGMVYNDNKAQSEMNLQESNCSSGQKYLPQKFSGHNSLDCMNDGAAGVLGDKKLTEFLTKPQANPTGRVDEEVKGSANKMSRIVPTGVVKVGSVHIKVNVAGESSSEIMCDGMGSLEPKEAEHIDQAVATKGS